MNTSSSLWVTMGLLIALGFRHGMDPDHIAAVDGLTRMRDKTSAYGSARLAGFQFACGHSLTILLATLIFYWQGIQLPQWLDAIGLWVSTVFLLWLAAANVRQCWAGQAHQHVPGPVQGLILRAMGPFAHPMGVGFAFAISFDSLAQAGLMAAKGHELGGVGMIVLLAFCFGLGMMLADTGNGLIMHWLLRRSDKLANHAGRWMSGVIACMAVLVVVVSHGSQHMPALETVWDAWGGWIGAGVTASMLGVFPWNQWLARPVRTVQHEHAGGDASFHAHHTRHSLVAH
jgi:high-affinity nickel-transport protein